MIVGQSEPVRILHVVGGMDRGGIQSWLMHVLRHIDRDRFRMDFLVHTDAPCAYDEEIRALGSRVLPCPDPSRPVTYGRQFRAILRQSDPYQVVHSHLHHFSGYVAMFARRERVPMRIVHSHNAPVTAGLPLQRRTYLALMKYLIRRHATLGLAVSREAAYSLFGPGWSHDGRFRIAYCGIELTSFAELDGRYRVRAEHGLPADAFVVGHVGRFDPQKNHRFLVEIAAAVVQREPHARFLLVGDGDLRQAIQQQVAAVGLADHVLFLGNRSDVPRLLGAMDAFLLPSLHEGLPLVGIEAQAAGLPIVLSDAVTPEGDVVPGMVTRLPLMAPAAAWADAILARRHVAATNCQQTALAALESSPFNITHGLAKLERIYATR